jgi:uncharacterized membrane protein YqjE
MSQENLLSSLKNIVATGSSIAQTRLELLSVDVQIARSKFVSLLVMIVCALFFLFFGLVMLSLLIVIYSWETNRMLALGLLTIGFISIGLILTFLAMRSLQTMPKLFEASIAEFAKDREELSK